MLVLASCSEVTGPEQTIGGEQLYDPHRARFYGIDGCGVLEQPPIGARGEDGDASVPHA
jgi:hypothetical protein